MGNTIIIESDHLYQNLIKKHLIDYSEINIIGFFVNTVSAIEFLKSNQCDLVIIANSTTLDLKFFLQYIHKNSPQIIAVTSEKADVSVIFDLDILDFINKPFTKERFELAITKFFKKSQLIECKKNEIVLKEGRYKIKINKNDILYIEGFGEYLKIHTLNKQTHIILSNFEEIYFKLNSTAFIRCHRSYMINRKHLIKVGANKCILIESKIIPLSKTYKNTISFNY